MARHYGLAAIFITPLTIFLAEASQSGHGAADATLLARLLDTVLGSVVGLVGDVYLHIRHFREVLNRSKSWLRSTRLLLRRPKLHASQSVFRHDYAPRSIKACSALNPIHRHSFANVKTSGVLQFSTLEMVAGLIPVTAAASRMVRHKTFSLCIRTRSPNCSFVLFVMLCTPLVNRTA